MNASTVNLDQLRVATPCPITWEQMNGDERIRFCDHCQLNGYNIAEFSRVEAQSLIASTEGRLCGRLYRRADGTVLTKDCPVGLRALRQRLAKRVAAVFAIMVGLSSATFGQQSSKKDKASCVPQTRVTHATESTAIPNSIAGTVMDINRAIIAGASVTITNNETQKTYRLKTNDEGMFQSESLPDGAYFVRIEIPGFKSLVATGIRPKNDKATNIQLLMEPKGESETVGILVAWPELIDSIPGTTVLNERAIRKLPINR